MGAQGEVFPPSYHTRQNPKVPSFTCTMGFFAKSFLWSFGVSVAFADYGGLRGGVETIDANVSADYGGLRGGVETIGANVSEAAPRGLASSCGLFRNHWGNPWDVVADVERSCDCAQKCNDDVLCKAWTHDGSKTCYLRRNKDGGYTLDHHVYGMTSGEKVEEVPPAVTAVDLISPYHYTQYGQRKRELFCDTDTFDYCFSCIDGLCTAVEKCTYGGTNLSVWAPGPSCYPCALPRL